MRGTTFMVMVCLIAAAVFFIEGHSVASAEPTTYFGESKPLGEGTVQSFMKVDEQGKPISIGVKLTKAGLSGLPSGEFPTEVMLMLPEKVSAPPFDHISVDWNAHGHEPPGVYDIPHFDIHFYMVSSAQRDKIAPDADAQFANAPAEGYLPKEYQPVPGGVPRMGAHWVDVTAPEFNGEVFTATFIYGSYDGAVTFYEPMVSQAFLETTHNFTANIKQPNAFQRNGYYPETYSVVYNEQTEEYSITLDQLTYH